jgi:hypothetical protein
MSGEVLTVGVEGHPGEVTNEGLLKRVDAVTVRVPDLASGLRNVDDSVAFFLDHGGELVTAPFDIPVGRAGVVRDPFGNTLVLVDLSKGVYVTDASGTVTGLDDGHGPSDTAIQPDS